MPGGGCGRVLVRRGRRVIVAEGRVASSGALAVVWVGLQGEVWSPEESMLVRFTAKLRPETPLDRRVSSYSAGCNKNQPRRRVPGRFRGFDRMTAGTVSLLGYR